MKMNQNSLLRPGAGETERGISPWQCLKLYYYRDSASLIFNMLKLSLARPGPAPASQPRHNDALISDIKPLSQNIFNENIQAFNSRNIYNFDGQMTVLAAGNKVAFNFL